MSRPAVTLCRSPLLIMPKPALIALVCGLFLFCQSAFCQKPGELRGPPPLEPAEGRREAQKLLANMLSQRPEQTNSGLLKIRGPRGPERVVPLVIRMNSTSTDSIAVYEATPTNSAGNKLTVVHSGQKPNEYRLAENSSGPEKSLSGDESMVPFAGSDFWVADLGLEFLHWPDQRVLKKELRRGQSCAVLESINPNPSSRGYSRVVSWIDLDEPHGIIHADAYDSQRKLVKVFDPKKIEKVRGEWQLASMEIRTLKPESRTIIEFNLDR